MEPQDLVTLDRKEILDPETVTHIFPDLDSLERQKLYVQKALELSRGIHEDMDVFENTVYVLNDLNPTIDVMEGSLPEHIWKAVLIITSIRPDLEFSHEVKMYIKMMFSSNGYLFFPENIGLDNKLLPQIKQLAENGPFPLQEDVIGIQAGRYLKIMTYIGDENAGK